MFELLMQTKKNLVKSLLISTLDKVIHYIGTFLLGSKNISLLHKIGWRSAEKISHFFEHASSRSSQDFYDCNELCGRIQGSVVACAFSVASSSLASGAGFRNLHFVQKVF
jgi:hypothetical protein